MTNKESNEIMPLTATTLPQEDKTTEAMKNKLKNAGIIPHEAKYWKEIN